MNPPPAAAEAGAPRWWQRGSLSLRILLGIVAGVAAGLFVGPEAAALQPLAEAYIRLMQMTVLPYLVVSLLIGLGQLDAAAARRLAVRGALILAVFWALTLVVIGVLSVTYPDVPHAVFFNPAILEAHRGVSFAELYFPANPFESLANGVVPAVVLFTGAVGVALIGMPNRLLLLDNLRVLEAAVSRVTRFIVALTPLGAFAVCAVAAGTFELDMLRRIEAYLLAFTLAALLLAFVLLPLAVTTVTPFRYREVVGTIQDALLTAFFASSVFIVLPILTQHAKTLMRRHGMENPETDSAADVLVPLAFTIPNSGRLLTLMFVPFSAWNAGIAMDLGDYTALFGAGIASYFAKAQVALPFLLDLAGVPHGAFDLYIPTAVVTGKLDSVVSVMALFALVLLGGASLAGRLRFELRRVLPALLAAGLLLALSAFGLRSGLTHLLGQQPGTADQLLAMQSARHHLPTTVLAAPPAGDCPAGDARSGAQRIRERGALRVGFVPDTVPYAFRNAAGTLVGFDLELADQLARDLGAERMEAVPLSWASAGAALSQCSADVMMSVPPTLIRPEAMQFTRPYMDSVLALAVKSKRRDDFSDVEALARLPSLVIGVPPAGQASQRGLQELLADTRARFVEIDTPRRFFAGELPQVDALVMRAEAAAAWTMLYPDHTFVVPQPDTLAVPLTLGLRNGDPAFAALLDNWLVVQQADGALKAARNYWMHGAGARPAHPRWSIRRDVLGW